MDSTDDADPKQPEDMQAEALGALERAYARGDRRLRTWIADGTLVDAQEFATRWSMSAKTLSEVEALRELPWFWVDGVRWYPSALLGVNLSDATKICRALGDDGPASKMFFFMHEHGGIGGLKVSAALPSVGLARVLQLAQAWHHR